MAGEVVLLHRLQPTHRHGYLWQQLEAWYRPSREGGLVVLAPSTGRRWVDETVPLAEASVCLLQPRRKKAWARIAPLGVDPKWWEVRVLQESCDRVAEASVGSRNTALLGATKDALRDCRHMGTKEVCVAMHHAAVGAGLPATEVQATILSALNSWVAEAGLGVSRAHG